MRFWSESYRPLAAEFVDGLQGMATLKMFGAARRRGEDLFRRAHDVRDSAIRLTNVSAVFWGVMAFIAGAGVAVALAAGAFRLADGAITPGQLMLILLLAGECFLPAREINEAMHLAVWGMSKCERAFAVLETEPAVGPPAGSRAARARDRRHRRPGRDVPLPAGRCARAPGRELLGRGGRDGGHRGAVGRRQDHARLAPAALRRSRGWDDPDRRARTSARSIRATLRRTIGLVPQDTFLFHETVAGNLRLTRPAATDDDLDDALGSAGAGGVRLGAP